MMRWSTTPEAELHFLHSQEIYDGKTCVKCTKPDNICDFVSLVLSAFRILMLHFIRPTCRYVKFLVYWHDETLCFPASCRHFISGGAEQKLLIPLMLSEKMMMMMKSHFLLLLYVICKYRPT